MSAAFSFKNQATTYIGIVKVDVCLELRIIYPRREIDRYYPFRLEDIPPESRNEARKRRGKETLVAQCRTPEAQEGLGRFLVECEGVCYRGQ
jgi:hypothetical protein